MTTPVANQPVISTPNGAMPKEGARVIPFSLDFTATNSWEVDLTAQFQNGTFTTLQTFFIDNSNNPAPVTITTGGIGESIVIPPRACAYMPVLQSTPPKMVVSSTQAAVVVGIIFMNFYIPPVIWSALTPATNTPVNISSLTDVSGTITLGGTPQSLIPASATRQRWIISNPSTATEILQISFGAGGAGKIDLLAGATWDESGSTVVGDAVFVNAATTGHAFKAYYK